MLFPGSTKEEITDVLFFSEPLVVASTNLSQILFCSFSLQSLFNILLPWKYLHLPAQHQSPILSQVKPPEQSADRPCPWLWEGGHESLAPTRVRITSILTPKRACQFCSIQRAKNSIYPHNYRICSSGDKMIRNCSVERSNDERGSTWMVSNISLSNDKLEENS